MTTPDAAVELLRCPFCGGESELHEPSPAIDAFSVSCNECEAATRDFDYSYGEARTEAIAAWNQRVPTDAERTARVEELEAYAALLKIRALAAEQQLAEAVELLRRSLAYSTSTLSVTQDIRAFLSKQEQAK